MEMALSNGFSEMSFEEVLFLDGGVKWDAVRSGLATGGAGILGGLAGGKIGASIGSVGGPAGTLIGGLVGAAAGSIIYTLWD